MSLENSPWKRDSITALATADRELTSVKRRHGIDYPTRVVTRTQDGLFPNESVSSRVNSPESGLTLKVAMRPDSWPAEKRNLS